MTKQINEAGTELVVDSIKILKGNGLTGAGVQTIERRLSSVESSVSIVLGQQSDYWTGVASDNIIIPEEKRTLKKELSIIDSEYTIIISNAQKAGVQASNEYQEYVQSYTALTKYLKETLKLFDNMAESTFIPSRSVFTAYYTNETKTGYYDTRELLQKVITDGFITTSIELSRSESVPVMDVSAPVVAVPSYTIQGKELTEYTPRAIRVKGYLVSGPNKEQYYTTIKVFRNGSSEPDYTVRRSSVMTYVIPDGTEELKFVMYDQSGEHPFDIEDIDFVTRNSGVTLHLSNKYQSFYSSSVVNNTNYFESKVIGFDGMEERPVTSVIATGATGFSFDYDNETQVLKISPTEEIQSNGFFEVYATVKHSAKAWGIIKSSGKSILGKKGSKRPLVIGTLEGSTSHTRFEYTNIEQEIFRDNLESQSGTYLGPVYSVNSMQDVRTGDYFVYIGQTIEGTIYKKGLCYVFDGLNWRRDTNATHIQATLTDLMSLADNLNDADQECIAVLFIQYLVANNAVISKIFSRDITLEDGGSIQSQSWVSSGGQSGFRISGDVFELKNGKFDGSIETGPMKLSKQAPGDTRVVLSNPTDEAFVKHMISIGFSTGLFRCYGTIGSTSIPKSTGYIEWNISTEYDNSGSGKFYQATGESAAFFHKSVLWGLGFGSYNYVYYYNEYSYRVKKTITKVKIVANNGTILSNSTYTDYKYEVSSTATKKLGYDSKDNTAGELVATSTTVTDKNGNAVLSSMPGDSYATRNRIGNVDLHFNTSSWTFILDNLPTGASDGLLPGTVYVDGSGYMKVVPGSNQQS